MINKDKLLCVLQERLDLLEITYPSIVFPEEMAEACGRINELKSIIERIKEGEFDD